jgi:hypothetical protein
LAGVDGVDPGRERGAEAVGEDLAEVADMPGGSIQLRAAGSGQRARMFFRSAWSSSLTAVGDV